MATNIDGKGYTSTRARTHQQLRFAHCDIDRVNARRVGAIASAAQSVHQTLNLFGEALGCVDQASKRVSAGVFYETLTLQFLLIPAGQNLSPI